MASGEQLRGDRHTVRVNTHDRSDPLYRLSMAARFYRTAKVATLAKHYFEAHLGGNPGTAEMNLDGEKLNHKLDKTFICGIQTTALNAYTALIYCTDGKATADYVIKGLKEDMKQEPCLQTLPQKPECDGYFPEYFNPKWEESDTAR